MPADRVSATVTSIEVLESLRQRGTAGVTEIANDIGGSKANVHKHLATLEDAHFVRSHDGEYQLAHRFLEFGLAAKRHEPVYRAGVDNLAKLADVTGATTVLVVREGREAVYLHTVVPVGQVGATALEGQRAPLPDVPAGLAILSSYPSGTRRSLVDATVDEPDRVEDILDRLDTAERESVIVTGSDESAGPEAVAAPVTDDGEPVGAVGLREPTAGTEGPRVEADLRKLVRNTAGTISNRIALTE
ncbi:IclR family transcriptional regulator [Halosimplex amylolyticum]|uniref:IclR family transcriptional regulator n=1 Tax=Halosimplex amylolyticum TaxID=3396616 RepID=UPI003F56D83C